MKTPKFVVCDLLRDPSVLALAGVAVAYVLTAFPGIGGTVNRGDSAKFQFIGVAPGGVLRQRLHSLDADARRRGHRGERLRRPAKAQLSPADFATVDAILRSSEFRLGETSGISCVLYSGPEHVSESVTRGTVQVGGDVSRCVAGTLTDDAGPAPANDYLDLYNVLEGY